MEKRCMGCMKTYSQEYDVCPHCGYVDGTPAKEAYHMEPGTVLHGKYIVRRLWCNVHRMGFRAGTGRCDQRVPSK